MVKAAVGTSLEATVAASFVSWRLRMDVIQTFSVRNLTKQYPGVKALDGVSMDFEPGTVHAIVGENGAGKSTLIKCFTGAISPTSGEIIIGNQSYNAMTPTLSSQLGISVIYQEFNQVPSMSAAENVFLGERAGKGKLVNTAERERMAKKLFERLNVDIDPSEKVRNLSPAQQQVIEIAKATKKNVKLLIMDEPTAPLTIHEVDKLFNIINHLKKQGVAIIYISHRLEEIFAIADVVSVLRDGKLIITKPVKDTTRSELIHYIAGREVSNIYPYHSNPYGKEVLSVEHLSGNGDTDISFTLHQNEILGFAGLVGAGRTELMQMLYGVVGKKSGKIVMEGKELNLKRPRDAMDHGIGYIPEDRKKQGVFLNQDVEWNCAINAIDQLSKGIVVNEAAVKKNAEKYVEAIHIKTPSLQQTVNNLSGGNQQKVVVAKTLAAKSNIIIFDEPTRGIDVGAKQEIYLLINQLADEGNSLIIVSSDLPELMGICDRIAVICEGRLKGILNRKDFNQDVILDLASGGNPDLEVIQHE